MAEMAPIAKTGGEAVVGQDLACMYPKFNNSRHVFILPYYNGQEQTAPGTKFITGYEIRKEEDGTPFYCTPNNINNPKEHYKLEKVAEKEIEWGQETALTGHKIKVELYKVDPAALQNKSIPKESEVYLVYAPMTACLEKNTAWLITTVIWATLTLNSVEQAELVPELNKPEYGNFNPKNVLCHDWHTSFFLNDANKKAAEGDDYFKGIQPGYVIHNLVEATKVYQVLMLCSVKLQLLKKSKP
jgi:glycogen synthase